MKLISLSFVLICFLLSARAEQMSNNGSEKMHQAPASAFELTPSLEYVDRTINGKSGGSLEQTGPDLSVKSEFGFNDSLSAGLILKYTSWTAKHTPSGTGGDEKGLNDPELFVNARIRNVGPGALRFGTSLSFSLDDNKVDSSGNSNLAHGGILLGPYAGYEMYFGQSTFGLRISYLFPVTNLKEKDSFSGSEVSETVTGGNDLRGTLFYEWTSDPAVLGFAFELYNHSKMSFKDDSTGVTREGSTYSAWDLNFYAPLTVASNVVLLPKFEYGQFTAFDSNISSITEWDLEFGVRLLF